MSTVLDVAKYFIYRSKPGTKWAVTHLKLQKLAYYAQGFYLAVNDDEEPLFTDRIEAWVHGPVCPTLYRRYSHHYFDEITEDINIDDLDLDDSAIEILDFVWDHFGSYDGKELENMTHDEEPWLNARNGLKPYESSNNLITRRSIKSYFQSEFISDN